MPGKQPLPAGRSSARRRRSDVDKLAAEGLAEELIEIVEEYEGLGAHERELMKAQFVEVLVREE